MFENKICLDFREMLMGMKWSAKRDQPADQTIDSVNIALERAFQQIDHGNRSATAMRDDGDRFAGKP